MFGQNKSGQQTGFAGFGNLASTSAASSSGFTFGTSSSALGKILKQVGSRLQTAYDRETESQEIFSLFSSSN